LYLTNFPNGTNWGSLTPGGTNLYYTNMVVYYQDALQTPYLAQIPYDFYIMTNRKSSGIFFTNWVSPILVPITNTPVNNVTNIWYAGYSFVTNAIFYDWREGWKGGSGPPKTIQAVQIDLKSYNAWLAGTNMIGGTNVNSGAYYNTLCLSSSHKSHPIDSIYIYNAVPMAQGTTNG